MYAVSINYLSLVQILLLNRMGRSKELTPALRERICELHAIKWGYRRIHQRYPWISISTIRYTIKKEPERQMGVSKPRSGRPKKLADDEARILYVITETPRVAYKDLLSEISYKVKKDSIQSLLNAENCESGDAPGGPIPIRNTQ